MSGDAKAAAYYQVNNEESADRTSRRRKAKMKANKLTLTATLLGVLGMVATAQAGPVFTPRLTAHLDSLATSGGGGGDKIDRKASVGTTRGDAHWASLRKEGSPCGDHINRAASVGLPRMSAHLKYSMDASVAPVK